MFAEHLIGDVLNMETKIPKKGDLFFTGFEDEVETGGEGCQYLTIAEVEDVIEDENGVEGRSITATDGFGYDCFWSKKYELFVYSLKYYVK
jgi:hypothetical protein